MKHRASRFFKLVGMVLPVWVAAGQSNAETMVFQGIAAQGGYVKESGENTHVGDTNNVVAGGVVWIGDTAYRKQTKGFVSFDTSALPDDAVVTNAVLRLRRMDQKGVNPFDSIGGAYADINLSNGFGNDLALAAEDFEARADGAEVAVMSNPLHNGDWSEGMLDNLGRRGIHCQGHTQFRIYHIPDDNDDSSADQIGYDSIELTIGYIQKPRMERSLPLLAPDCFHGLRTKWEKYSAGTDGETRASISPDMRGLNHVQWAQAIERTGANGCTINVEARNNLLKTAKYSLGELTPELISQGQFTPDQRNAEQMRFLLGLEEAREQGHTTGSFRFHAHQRLYPDHDPVKEQQFVDDFAGFINCARAMRLDHWIRGIRLGENGINKSNLWYTMDIAKWWADQINGLTDDWLKSRGMEIHGGRMGIYFNDIDSKANSGTFFQLMNQKTGYFSWCFKFFYEDDFNADMAAQGLDSSNKDDIKTFLRTECGFADLEAFVQVNRSAYPMHANCIFVGDSGDAMKLIGNKKLQALTEMFNEAGDGFRGIVAVNGYSWEDENSLGDAYKTLYIVDPTGSDPVLNPNSYALWSAWPNIETGTTDPVETVDAHVDLPFAVDLIASIDSGPSWLISSNGMAAGTPSTTDLGINAFRIREASGTEKTLLVTVLDKIHYNTNAVFTHTSPGRSYVLESCTNLLSASWDSIGSAQAGDGSTCYIGIDSMDPNRYYRLRIERE